MPVSTTSLVALNISNVYLPNLQICVQTTLGFVIREFQPSEVFAESVSSLIIKVIHQDGA